MSRAMQGAQRAPVADPAAPARRQTGLLTPAWVALFTLGASFATPAADGPAQPALVAGGGAFTLAR